ncbi:Clan CA, family C54, ATG4-like cysteine peptidase [Tritrichomonas foetus]|uniref:Cysteine protease n=1 Tax=Tritrichomonas foetus TaxID=1144522 RepID=A0A1J4KGH5_9EUKA|nr:Clan CA, family C54, ATG4-like cysteine peptidase [Tritrichomonas foetus]|eukprot:OHT08429.1 Clan CA, family C54, ATG4-like cysteine peptidase [Tritrichomonas foetus]
MTTILGVECNDQDDQLALISTIPRFTYRKGFRALQNENHSFTITSDTHWGCCIRCGQSLVAQYVKKLLMKFPKYYNSHFPKRESFLSLFNDTPDAPFSIHNICKEVIKNDGHEGEWVSVSKLSKSLENLMKPDFPIYVCENSTIVIEEIKPLFTGESSVLCLIPLMCGFKKFDSRCFQTVVLSVTLPEGIGFISGHKGKAHYFVGVSSKFFYFFDPHTTKKYVQQGSDQAILFDPKLKSMKINDISPSLLLGFAWDSLDEMMSTIECMRKLKFCPISIVDVKSETVISANDDWDIVEEGEVIPSFEASFQEVSLLSGTMRLRKLSDIKNEIKNMKSSNESESEEPMGLAFETDFNKSASIPSEEK